MVAALAGCGVPLTMGPPHTRTQPKRSRATTTLAAAAHSSCTATDDSWASTTHSSRPLCMSQQWSCRTDSANRRSVDSSTHSADATPATLSMDRCSATRYGGGGGKGMFGKSNYGNKGAGPVCYNCHGVGHLARDCPLLFGGKGFGKFGFGGKGYGKGYFAAGFYGY